MHPPIKRNALPHKINTKKTTAKARFSHFLQYPAWKQVNLHHTVATQRLRYRCFLFSTICITREEFYCWLLWCVYLDRGHDSECQPPRRPDRARRHRLVSEPSGSHTSWLSLPAPREPCSAAYPPGHKYTHRVNSALHPPRVTKRSTSLVLLE